jgi:hypothetical protein
MKQFKYLLIGFLLVFFCTAAYSQSKFTYSSGLLTSSRVISAEPILLTDVAVYTDSTGLYDATVILYNSPSGASGTVLGKCTVLGAAKNGGLFIPVPVKASSGIYMSITGSGASAIIFTTPQ